MKCMNFMNLVSSLLAMKALEDVQPQAVYSGSWVPGCSFSWFLLGITIDVTLGIILMK